MNKIKELSTANGEDVAANRVEWTESRKASRRATEEKSEGMTHGCMSQMMRARLILVSAMVYAELLVLLLQVVALRQAPKAMVAPLAPAVSCDRKGLREISPF